MADRAKRRRRERMILAASAKPFEIAAGALAKIEAGPADSTGPAPVTVEAYGGGVMNVNGIGPCVVDIAGIESQERVVLLDGHTNTLAASLGSASLEPRDGKLYATGTISRTTPAAQIAIDLARDGVPIQASIGAEPTSPPVRVREGQTVHVNGRDITAGPGGFLLFKTTRIRHIAILPNGADASTTVSIAAEAASPEGNTMTFEEWIASLGLDITTLSDEQKANLMPVYDALQAAAGESEDEEEKPVEAAAKEDEEKTPAAVAAEALTAIRAEASKEPMRIAAIREKCGGKFPAIEAQAIAEGWDADKTELAIHRARRPNGVAAIHTTESGNLNTQVIEAAICMKAGIPVEASYKEQVLDSADKIRHRRFDWMAEQIAAKHGRELPGAVGSKAWIEAAFSTVDMPGIVGNVANKALQNAFESFPSIAEKICGTISRPNFHKYTVYSMAMGGELKEVGKGGELKHLKTSEESYEGQVKTRGAVLRITEEDLVNDDLGAFNRAAKALANKALVSREKAVFTALNATANGASFFTTANGNYFEGSGSALSHTSLATAQQKFMDQTGPDGDPTMLTPRILVVPTALFETGKTLLTSDFLIGPTSSKQPSANIWKGAFELMTSPFLSNSNITGYSSTAFYLLGDPSIMPAIELAYLNDQRTPTVEFFGMDHDVETLGVAWRVTYRFGVALAEYRAGVKSRGNAA